MKGKTVFIALVTTVVLATGAQAGKVDAEAGGPKERERAEREVARDRERAERVDRERAEAAKAEAANPDVRHLEGLTITKEDARQQEIKDRAAKAKAEAKAKAGKNSDSKPKQPRK